MNTSRSVLSLALLACSATLAPADDLDTQSIITEMAQSIEQNYVFPEMGSKAADLLSDSLEAGAYDGLDQQSLAMKLNQQLRELTNDLHFSVRPLPEGWAPTPLSTESETEAENDPIRRGPPSPHGFTSVQRLSGNIGYIELRGFVGAIFIEDTVEAAMRLMQDADAIIFDLRQNGGGDPAAVQLISSYLFDPETSVHLNSLYFRPDDTTTEFWTHDGINTQLAMPEIPVYVLTSRRTFSAAEEFTYNLQNLKRATIIGETTGGGAHPVNSMNFDNRITLVLPIARAINPITGTNWEGTGVAPDVEIEASKALDTAQMMILENSLAAGNESARWGIASIKSRISPIECSLEQLAEYAGDYEDRHLRIVDGVLEYRREGVGDWSPLVCFEKDQFMIEGIESFIMEFTRDEQGSVSGIIGNNANGYTDTSKRDG